MKAFSLLTLVMTLIGSIAVARPLQNRYPSQTYNLTRVPFRITIRSGGDTVASVIEVPKGVYLNVTGTPKCPLDILPRECLSRYPQTWTGDVKIRTETKDHSQAQLRSGRVNGQEVEGLIYMSDVFQNPMLTLDLKDATVRIEQLEDHIERPSPN